MSSVQLKTNDGVDVEKKSEIWEDGEQKTLYFQLEPEAEVALLARMLDREGYNDKNWGHITYIQDDGTILMNPWEVPWAEMRASDILKVDESGNLLSGRWTVTPAVQLHLAAHRLRKDVKVAIHHHGEWGLIWGSAGELPEIYNQSSAQIFGDVVLYDEYEDTVVYKDIAERNIKALGDNNVAILKNHGVFIMADSIKRAHLFSTVLETRCRTAWRVKAMGMEGAPMKDSAVEALVKSAKAGRSGNRMYHAMIRREVLKDPSVLT